MRLIIFLAFVGSMFAQTTPSTAIDHARTTDQCRADQILLDSQFSAWTDALDKGHPFSSPLGQMNMVDLQNKRAEMLDCETIDVPSLHDYKTTFYHLSTIVADRCVAYFIKTGKSMEYDLWESEQRRK